MTSRLLPFLVASITLAAPAAADYRACMEFCTKEHAFGHCNDVCSRQSANRPGPSPAAQPGSPTPPAPRANPPASKAAIAQPPIPDVLKGRVCGTAGDKADALFHYIGKSRENVGMAVYPARPEEDPSSWDGQTFEIDYALPPDGRRGCTGFIRISDDCRVLSEDFKCRFRTE